MTRFLQDTIFGITIKTWLIAAGCALVVLGILYLIFRKKANAFIKKHRELVLYVVFGALTTVVNYIVYYPLTGLPGVRELSWWPLVVNVIAWVAAVAFAYVTNKIFVFESRDKSKKTVIRELLSFVGARVASLLIEEAVIAVFATAMGLNANAVKLVASVITVVLNYFFSKLIVFRKNGTKAK